MPLPRAYESARPPRARGVTVARVEVSTGFEPLSPLDELLASAGATMAYHGDHEIVAHFGSPAGELSVCLEAVGIGHRGEAMIAALTGPPADVSQALNELGAGTASTSHLTWSDDAWWAPVDSDRLLALARPGAREELTAALDGYAGRTPGLSWTEVSDAHEAIAVVGPHSAALLGEATGDVDDTLPPSGDFCDLRVGRATVLALHEAPQQYTVLARRDEAVAVWHALESEGGDLDLGYVGEDALDHYAVFVHNQARRERRGAA